jgi:hypothetical protein
MELAHMPGCCTSAILYSFGEHQELSELTNHELTDEEKIEAIKVMTGQKLFGQDLAGNEIGHMRCIFAISVDPKHVKLLKAAGFRVVDAYKGIQGRVNIMTLHIGDGV